MSAIDNDLPEVETQDGVERRKNPRTSCNWRAVVRLGNGATCDATVVDVSEGGMRLLADVPVEKGSQLIVELDEIGRYSCEVRWHAPGQFGVMFLKSPEELSDIELEELSAYLCIDGAGLPDE